MLRVMRWIGWSVATIAAGSIVVVVALLTSGTYHAYVIHTGSMNPTIPPGSMVIVRTGENIGVGKVVVFDVTPRDPIAHRLIAIRPDGTITTKGDGNKTADPLHPKKSTIVGGVAYAPRQLGFIWVIFTQPSAIAALLLFIMALFLTVRLFRAPPAPPRSDAPQTESVPEQVTP